MFKGVLCVKCMHLLCLVGRAAVEEHLALECLSAGFGRAEGLSGQAVGQVWQGGASREHWDGVNHVSEEERESQKWHLPALPSWEKESLTKKKKRCHSSQKNTKLPASISVFREISNKPLLL